MANEREMAKTFREEQKARLEAIYAPMTEEVELPSGGAFYASGAKTVTIKPMTAKEEDILSNEKLLRSGKAFDELIKSCVVNWNGIHFNELLVGDKNTIQIAIRVISLGADYNEIPIICPHCQTKAVKDINLTQDLKLKYLNGTPDKPGQNLFSWVSPKGINFKVRLITHEDQIEMAREKKRKKAMLKENYKDSTIHDYLVHSIVEIEGIQDKSEIVQILENMRSDELRALMAAIRDISPDYDMTYEHECYECEEISKVTIPMTAQFFWPDGRSNK